ncbi:MAG: VOC family protein [Thermoplasmata archaeon]|nr:VOC family protein [Thermoplasmata archaeon]
MALRKPDTPRIFRVLLQVDDLDRSQRFYESLLANRGRKVGGGRVYFDCGPTIFALVDISADGGQAAATLPEALYFATDDVDGVYRRARKLGCLSPALIHNDPTNPAGEIVVRPWGERSFYAADPSGNPLCFVDAGTLFTGLARPAGVPRGNDRHRRQTRSPETHRSPERIPRPRKRA